MTSAKTRAVIWDMDGVIVDTAPYHLKAWQEAFRKRGTKFTEADFRHTFGQRNDTIIKSVLGEGTSSETIEAISPEKEACFRRRIQQHIQPLPGVIELLKSLKKRGFKMALASSAPMENIELLTRSLDIDSCFQAVISDRDVIKGKPDPQVFQLAARKLGVAPEDCVVIEDAVAGVTAAKRAGMRCLAVTNTHPAASLAEADLIVNTLETVSMADLDGLIKPS